MTTDQDSEETDEKNGEETVAPFVDEDLRQIAPLIERIIARRLGALYRDAVEDLKQKVFLKLLNRKKAHAAENLTKEEWRKLANVTAQNEVIDFFRAKYSRDVPFSQMNEAMELKVYSQQTPEPIAGNSQPEVCSLLKLVWQAAQNLTLRQKYSYFLQFSDFIIEFIVCRCCSIEELARYFEVNEQGLSAIITELPLADASIGNLLERKLTVKIAPKQIWEARSKAKMKLAASLKDSVFNERPFNPKRN